MNRNLGEPVGVGLKQRTNATKQDFNLTLTHYGLERLLYRLSVLEHASNFTLMGALLFTLWYDLAYLPTCGVDLSGFSLDKLVCAAQQRKSRQLMTKAFKQKVAREPAIYYFLLLHEYLDCKVVYKSFPSDSVQVRKGSFAGDP